MYQRLTVILLLLPFFADAQYWRVQASGGIATSQPLGHAQTVWLAPPPRANWGQSFPVGHIPEDAAPFGVWGLSLLRRMGSLELGLQIEALSIRRRQSGSYMYYDSSNRPVSGTYKVTGYLGRPVVPITAVCNYYAGAKRSNAFIGIHAGVAYASGRSQPNFSELPLGSDLAIYFNSAWGFAAGIQAGYRQEIGAFDLGFQLQAKYFQFNLQHGDNPNRYSTKMLVLPAQLYAGYRLGDKKAAPAKAPVDTEQ